MDGGKEANPPLNLLPQQITENGCGACSEVPGKEGDGLSWKWLGGLCMSLCKGIIKKERLISAIPDFKTTTIV